jgi:hypothetical protein
MIHMKTIHMKKIPMKHKIDAHERITGTMIHEQDKFHLSHVTI